MVARDNSVTWTCCATEAVSTQSVVGASRSGTVSRLISQNEAYGHLFESPACDLPGATSTSNKVKTKWHMLARLTAGDKPLHQLPPTTAWLSKPTNRTAAASQTSPCGANSHAGSTWVAMLGDLGRRQWHWSAGWLQLHMTS